MFHQLNINAFNFRKTIELQDSFYSIGRHSSNSIIIPSAKISKNHAVFIKK